MICLLSGTLINDKDKNAVLILITHLLNMLSICKDNFQKSLYDLFVCSSDNFLAVWCFSFF